MASVVFFNKPSQVAKTETTAFQGRGGEHWNFPFAATIKTVELLISNTFQFPPPPHSCRCSLFLPAIYPSIYLIGLQKKYTHLHSLCARVSFTFSLTAPLFPASVQPKSLPSPPPPPPHLPTHPPPERLICVTRDNFVMSAAS